jgi:thymidylate synthase
MNKLDKDYTNLLQDILDNGVEKKDRTGTGTISVFGRQIRHKMSDGFPLLTTKKMYMKGIITELIWFLRGDTNIKYLVDNGCNIWNGDAYKSYCKWWEESDDSCNLTEEQSNKWLKLVDDGLQWAPLSQEEFINKIKTDDEFAKKWGELGPIYGKQWRGWVTNGFNKQATLDKNSGNFVIDQIANLIHDLKINPDSRRLKVNAWNVGELDQMTLPPCHYSFQVYTRELSELERWNLYCETCNNLKTESIIGSTNKEQMNQYYEKYNIPTRAISLMFNMRSVDTFLGLPFNIASYGLLLEIIAKSVNMVPDELIGNLGDTHLYSNHIEQAKEQIGREFTENEIQEHLQQSGMDALKDEPRMEYISKLPKRTREPYPLPTLKINSGNENWGLLDIDEIINSLDCDLTFKLENYQSHPTIKAPLSN